MHWNTYSKTRKKQRDLPNFHSRSKAQGFFNNTTQPWILNLSTLWKYENFSNKFTLAIIIVEWKIDTKYIFIEFRKCWFKRDTNAFNRLYRNDYQLFSIKFGKQPQYFCFNNLFLLYI